MFPIVSISSKLSYEPQSLTQHYEPMKLGKNRNQLGCFWADELGVISSENLKTYSEWLINDTTDTELVTYFIKDNIDEP